MTLLNLKALIMNETESIIITEPKNIAAYGLLVTHSQIHLECLGFKFKFNITQAIRERYGFKGRKREDILRQFENYLEDSLGTTLKKRYTERQ